MTTTIQKRTTEGDQLRALAMEKLRRASAMVESAVYDLQNLEGRGYCNQYEQTRKLIYTIDKRQEQIQRLKPPTGVFKI